MASFDDVQSRRSRDKGPIGTVPHRKPEEPERKPRDEAETTGGSATSARGSAGARHGSQGGEDNRLVQSPEVEERSRSLDSGRKAKSLKT